MLRLDDEEIDELIAYCGQHRSAMLATLPFVASEIVGLSSFATLLAVVRSHGGGKMYIPARCSPFTRIVKLIGQEHANRLIDHFGPGHIQIPPFSSIVRTINQMRIRQLHQSGMSNQGIARTLGIHQITVARTLNKYQGQPVDVVDLPGGANANANRSGVSA